MYEPLEVTKSEEIETAIMDYMKKHKECARAYDHGSSVLEGKEITFGRENERLSMS